MLAIRPSRRTHNRRGGGRASAYGERTVASSCPCPPNSGTWRVRAVRFLFPTLGSIPLRGISRHACTKRSGRPARPEPSWPRWHTRNEVGPARHYGGGWMVLGSLGLEASGRVCGGAGGGGPSPCVDGLDGGAGSPDSLRRTRPGDRRGAAVRRRHRNDPGHGRSIQGPSSSPPPEDRGSVVRGPESTRRTPGRCLAGDLHAATPGTGPRVGRREVERGRAEGCRVPPHSLEGFV
jgi:hypothetical protein